MRRRSSLAGSPLLIGAITTLIVVVAVYLSYNANNGLPFTPTYNIKVELPEAYGLQPSNQVRIGGTRVGVVQSLAPHQDPATGKLTVIANLKLEKSVQPLPADTRSDVQSVSAIGLKYLDLEKGASDQTLKPGATIPLAQSHEPVQIEDFFNMFDKPTRIANQRNLNTFGDAFAGRGLGLNETLATLRPLVIRGVPALRNLNDPNTRLRELFVALEQTAAEVAPVAQANASFFRGLDTFFTAFASVAPSLEETIEGGPPALRQAIYSLPFEAPFVEKSTEFMRLLRPSAAALATTAAPLGHAFAEGAVNLNAATALSPEIAEAAQAFEAFAKNPVVTRGLEDLTQTSRIGTPLVTGLAPAQTNCNYVTLLFRNISSLLSESVGVGTAARVMPVLAPGTPLEQEPLSKSETHPGNNSEGLPASAPANGGSVDLNSAHQPIDDNHLHVNPYPYVGGPGQPKVCEAGNERFIVGQNVTGNVPGTTSTVHDATTRSQGLNGQTYPSSTLKDLGLTSSSTKGTAK